MKDRVVFLGTGTSQGVPMIGCRCDVCASDDPRDKRLRSSVYVEYGGCAILVDAGPDFRQQMLTHGILHLDAILLTHNHKDHTGGLDDVRAINFLEDRPIDIFCEDYVVDSLRQEYSYVFDAHRYPGIPQWNVHTISLEPFLVHPVSREINARWLSLSPQAIERFGLYCAEQSSKGEASAVEIIPVRGMHYRLPVLGFRFGKFAYLTDMNYIPESEFGKLCNLDVLTVNCVKHGHHISHFSFEQAIEVALRVRAKRTYLTHMSHQLEKHSILQDRIVEEVTRQLSQAGRPVPPSNEISRMISPAYDSLEVVF